MGAVAVFALDLCRMEIMDGLVDKGGDGRLLTSRDVRELITFGVGAMDGDCSGDCIGSSLRESSVNTGGNNGVVACGRLADVSSISSSASGKAL